MMNRQQKEKFVETLKADFSDAQAAFLVGVRGLSVSQIQGLRAQVRQNGGKLKVAKITLMKRAIDDLACADDLNLLLKHQLAVIFAQSESPAIAKILQNYSKENSLFEVVGGFLDTRVLDKQAVMKLASLPSKEILLAQTCGTLIAPISGLATVLNMLILRLLFVLNQIEKKKSS
jgi:large subunit ribosomal protein L10